MVKMNRRKREKQLQRDQESIYDLHQRQLAEDEANIRKETNEQITITTELTAVDQMNKESQHINLIKSDDDDVELENEEYDEAQDPLDIDNESDGSHDAMYMMESTAINGNMNQNMTSGL
eukprot:430100_1